MGITITEALAEIKTVNKRIETKRKNVASYLARQEGVRDPLEKDGGSPKVIEQERQSIRDLEQRLIDLRRNIQRANDITFVTIGREERSISEWLTWRRDVAPGQKNFLAQLQAGLSKIRNQAQSQGSALISANASVGDAKPTDIVVNINEGEIAREIEQLEETLGTLDGQLSLKNATVPIE